MLDKLVGGEQTTAAEGVATIISDLAQTEEEKRVAAIFRNKLIANAPAVQTALNISGHRTFYTAGWRPSIGWICALALIWNLIGYDISVLAFDIKDPPPLTSTEHLYTVLFALLGLGGMRTYEKLQRRAK